jgi:PIN domain nuclease of toxin-antitoxin system
VIVVDTHALFWWRTRSRLLSGAALRAIERADRVIVPDAVCFEIALLAHRGRIRLSITTREWLELTLAEPSIELMAITPEIAVAAASIQQRLARDPSVSLIAATALRLNAPLATKDDDLRELVPIETIW